MIDLEAGGDGARTEPLRPDCGKPMPLEPLPSLDHGQGAASDPAPVTVQVVPDESSHENSPSAVYRWTRPFRYFASALRHWNSSAASSQPPPSHAVPDTVYMREAADDSTKRRLSEENAETESLLTAEDKEESDAEVAEEVIKIPRTREEEHQMILEAMQKRFVCPNFAAPKAPPVTVVKKPSDAKTGKIKWTGHLGVIPSEKSFDVDNLIARLDEAFHERIPPFDTWDNLLEKLSDVQRKQLVLNCANLEMAWSRNLGSADDDAGSRAKESSGLTTFHEMMDELSRDVMVLQNIDLQEASDTLPRRKSSDQPDLQALHARLFRSQDELDPTKDLRPFLKTQVSSPVGAVSQDKPVSPSPRTFTVPNLKLLRTTGEGPDAHSVHDNLKSEPPRYPPPPVPSVIELPSV